MNDRDLTASPLTDPRYGAAMAAALGMYVAVGKKPKPAGVVGKILRRLILGKPGDRR